MKKLFIVIVTYNPESGFTDLIKSLMQEKLKDYQIEILIINNGSARDLRFKIYDLRIKVIENRENLGFAAGCNVGIRYALKNGADAILLLNQDVTVEKGFIKPLIDNPADLVAPVIRFKRKDRWIYDYGGKINWWWGRTEHIEKSLKFKVQSAKLREGIDYVSGCCILLKKNVFQTIGLFNEDYFLYFEDVDLCLRARKVGLTLAVEPKSMITHNLIEGREKPLRQYLHLIRSNFIFISKYLHWRIPFGYLYLLALTGKILMEKLFK